METRIEPYRADQQNAVVQLSLRAWAPVFDSLRNVFGPELYQLFYPDEWEVAQRTAVEAALADESMNSWVAVDADTVLGFVAVRLHKADQMGEIYMIAVDPDAQKRGIASALTHHVIEWMKTAGMSLAMVETGADPGHAPARRTYEKMGFRLFPVARYFRKL